MLLSTLRAKRPSFVSVPGTPMIRVEITCELVERLLVNVALEFNHCFKRNPIVIPAPRIKFRMITGAQRHIAVTPSKTEQKPDLFLPSVTATPFAFDPVNRHIVTQPVLSSAKNTDMLGAQADLFIEFPVHRLLGSFSPLDATLWKLPRMFSNPLTPKNLVLRVT